MSRALQLDAPSAIYSTQARALADAVRERTLGRDWLQLVEDEWGYLMAVARSIAEQRKEVRDANQEL